MVTELAEQPSTPAVGYTCTINGCDKPRRSRRAVLCKMHYHRQYRHGSPLVVARGPDTPSVSLGRRYQRAYLPRHPLAGADGKVYVHRQVLYDLIGAGSHPCHWCGAMVSWLLPKGDPSCLHVDHLNGIGDDNRPENLVPSCRTCNSTRGVQARARALRAAGWWASHDTVARLRADGRVPQIEHNQ